MKVVPMDYEAVITGMDEDTQILTAKVRELTEWIVALVPRAS